MTQGAPKNIRTTAKAAEVKLSDDDLIESTPDGPELDLDSWLGKRGLLLERRLKVAGKSFRFTASTTGDQIVAYNTAINKGSLADALAVLLVDPSEKDELVEAFKDQRQPLSAKLEQEYFNHILNYLVTGSLDGAVGGILGVLIGVIGPWWDAVLTDFRQYFQLDLRAEWRTMPAVDLVAHVHRLTRIRDAALYDLLTEGLGHWGPHEENTARLLEAQVYALELIWADRITDPDDPAVKRERAQAKRAGIKPPPHPLIPPVAYRPPPVAEQRLREYLDAAARYSTKPPPEVRHLTSAEFDRVLGLTAEHV